MASAKIFAVLLLSTIFSMAMARPSYGGGYVGHSSPISYASWGYPSYSYPRYGYGHNLHSSYSYPLYGYGHGLSSGYGYGLDGWLGDYW